jgi:hypothetical protein
MTQQNRLTTVLKLARQYLPVRPRRGMQWKLVGDDIPGGAHLLQHAVTEGLSIWYDQGFSYHDAVLHELCHALIGPISLHSEKILMPVQWRLMQRLVPSEYELCRATFAGYSLYGEQGDIGISDAFLRRDYWRESVQLAIRKNWLTKRGCLRPRKMCVDTRAWRAYQLRARRIGDKMDRKRKELADYLDREFE